MSSQRQSDFPKMQPAGVVGVRCGVRGRALVLRVVGVEAARRDRGNGRFVHGHGLVHPGPGDGQSERGPDAVLAEQVDGRRGADRRRGGRRSRVAEQGLTAARHRAAAARGQVARRRRQPCRDREADGGREREHRHAAEDPSPPFSHRPLSLSAECPAALVARPSDWTGRAGHDVLRRSCRVLSPDPATVLLVDEDTAEEQRGGDRTDRTDRRRGPAFTLGRRGGHEVRLVPDATRAWSSRRPRSSRSCRSRRWCRRRSSP